MIGSVLEVGGDHGLVVFLGREGNLVTVEVFVVDFADGAFEAEEGNNFLKEFRV